MVKNCPIIKVRTIFGIYRLSAFQWCPYFFLSQILSAQKIKLKKTTSRARNRIPSSCQAASDSRLQKWLIVQVNTIFEIYRLSAFHWCFWFFSILILNARKINFKKITTRARIQSFREGAAVKKSPKKMVSNMVKKCHIVKFSTICKIFLKFS